MWFGPWICAGDFNEALSKDEHLSRGDRGENQMRLFRECLDDCDLVDLGFSWQTIHGTIGRKGTTMLKFAWTEQ